MEAPRDPRVPPRTTQAPLKDPQMPPRTLPDPSRSLKDPSPNHLQRSPGLFMQPSLRTDSITAKQPAAISHQPAASSQQPAASSQRSAASSKQQNLDAAVVLHQRRNNPRNPHGFPTALSPAWRNARSDWITIQFLLSGELAIAMPLLLVTTPWSPHMPLDVFAVVRRKVSMPHKVT